MNIRSVLALLFVAGYIVFELYAIQSAGYRTEPDFIFNEFVGIQQASKRCGDPSDEVTRQFSRNLDSVQRGARKDYVEQNPDLPDAEVAAYIGALIDTRTNEVNQLIDSQGCESADVRRLVVLYERRANLNLR